MGVAPAPVRKGILTIDHYTREQRVWAIKRHHAGGRVFLLLKVGTLWLLFYGHIAAEYLGKVTLEKLKEVAIKTWVKKLDKRELKELVTKN